MRMAFYTSPTLARTLLVKRHEGFHASARSGWLEEPEEALEACPLGVVS